MLDLDLIKKLEDVNFGSQINLYLSRKLKYDNYDIYFSDNIDDTYWNLATNIKDRTKDDFYKDLTEIKNIFNSNNRQPAIYITPTSPLYLIKEDLGLFEKGTDVWMILKDLNNFPSYKSKLELTIIKVDKTNIDEFIESVMRGFSSDDPGDPYEELSDGYRIALQNSVLRKNDSNYKINHYLVKYNGENVATATAIYNGEIAFIYNVTTKREYRKNNICKELMSHIVNDLNNDNVKMVCLQTEKGFYPEQVYLNMGFENGFEGTTYICKDE